MECRQASPPWAVFPDPQQTPDAHEATRGTFYGCACASLVFGLFLLWILCERSTRWEEDDGIRAGDKLHVGFYILSTLGYVAAGLATQFYPGDINWAIQISKVVIILAWSCLLLASCGAAEAMGAGKCRIKLVRTLELVVVLAGLAEVVIPGDRHFQGFMWSLAALALSCAFPWFVVWQHDRPKEWRKRSECGPSAVFRVEFHILAAAGFAFVAITEPSCGYAGYAACYANCFVSGSPGPHFPYSLIGLMPFYLALAVMQGYRPYPCVFPAIPRWSSGAEPDRALGGEQVPPSAQG
ncbi:unnamed protein product [Symbiodinium sp. CCMP2592]|nr:unnamed protein product [Symbiodinium sp. CCMP2592]